ncbi:hypothetical protein BDR03DRAFT_1032750 [Suillus americanus]|nr:hypothetical protein BDR03DRAFT_1032750 [Suillus americanus]
MKCYLCCPVQSHECLIQTLGLQWLKVQRCLCPNVQVSSTYFDRQVGRCKEETLPSQKKRL